MQPSWSEGGTTRHNFGRGPSNDYFIKVWFQLSNWFQTRRFLCEFPIGSYVKLSSAVGAILVEGSNCLTYFWKRTIQWLFHQHLVLIEQMVSNKKIFMGISHGVLCSIKFGCGGHLGRRSEISDINLEGNHPRIISAKFGWDWLSSFRGEDFFKFHPPFFYFELGGHLGWKSGSPDTILEGSHPRIISAKFGWDWLSSFRGEDFFLISTPLFSNLHNRSKSAKAQSS